MVTVTNSCPSSTPTGTQYPRMPRSDTSLQLGVILAHDSAVSVRHSRASARNDHPLPVRWVSPSDMLVRSMMRNIRPSDSATSARVLSMERMVIVVAQLTCLTR